MVALLLAVTILSALRGSSASALRTRHDARRNQKPTTESSCVLATILPVSPMILYAAILACVQCSPIVLPRLSSPSLDTHIMLNTTSDMKLLKLISRGVELAVLDIILTFSCRNLELFSYPDVHT
jgi:hypothetical protein